MEFNYGSTTSYLQNPFFRINIMDALKAIVAGIREFSNGQEMNVTMTNPRNSFVTDVSDSTFEIRCVAHETRDIFKSSVIKVRTDFGCFNTRCLFDIIRIIVIIVSVHMNVLINFVTHQLIVVGVEGCAKSCANVNKKKKKKKIKIADKSES